MKLLPTTTGRFRLALLLLGGLLALAPWASAQQRIGVNVPFLVKDINTTASERLSSNPQNFTTIGAVTYFMATDPTLGAELWRSDGTAAGTWMVKDINPGLDSSNPSQLSNMGGTLYFVANDGIHGTAPWKSDGTAAGTMMIKDIQPSTVNYTSANSSFFYYLGGSVYFFANDGAHGTELWRTDGTAAGTIMLKDANPAWYDYPAVRSMSSMNGKLFFLHPANSTPVLWASDGTPDGTVMIKTLTGYNSATALVSLNGALYFATGTGAMPNGGGYDLWKSDGTAAGTVLVKHFPAGKNDTYSRIYALTTLNGQLVFYFMNCATAQYTKELWRSDGTAAGTVMIKSFPITSTEYLTDPLRAVNGVLYLSATDTATGQELWRSDGTTAGTRLVKDINPGKYGSMPASLMEVGGKLWFGAYDGGATQLWHSDGTTAGTTAVTDFKYNGNCYLAVNATYWISPPTPGGICFFSVSDKIHGAELWKSGGTPASTAMVKDIAVGSDSRINRMTPAGKTLFFAANDTIHGIELWQSNGTAAGTSLVKDIWPGQNGGLNTPASTYPDTYESFVNSLITYSGGTTWFVASGFNDGLWKSNGTAAGTVAVKDGFTKISAMAAAGGRIFMLAMGAGHGYALWMTNAAGTDAVWLRDFDVNTGYPMPPFMANVNGTIFFSMTGTASCNGLWKSNGTPAGTVRLSSTSPATKLVAAGSRVFYTAHSTSLYELWSSDGTTASTERVKNINYRDPLDGPNVRELTTIGNILYFTAYGSNSTGQELWRSDGTDAGTYLVRDICPGSASSAPRNLTAVGNTLYFCADDGVHGPELWKSNGTAASTVLVCDINPGAGGSNPCSMANVDGTLYFNAYHPTSGSELWVSDGTAPGTALLGEIAPGPASSNPAMLTQVGRMLFFRATNSTTNQGMELWGVKLPGAAAAPVWQAYR